MDWFMSPSASGTISLLVTLAMLGLAVVIVTEIVLLRRMRRLARLERELQRQSSLLVRLAADVKDGQRDLGYLRESVQDMQLGRPPVDRGLRAQTG